MSIARPFDRRRGLTALLVAASFAAIASVVAPVAPQVAAETASSPAGAASAAAGSIASGYVNSCAVLATGTVRCWGAADQGVLGQGTGSGTDGSLDVGDDEAPTAIGSVPLGVGRTARSISMRYKHACAVLDNGAVRCWGNGEEGVLGTGTTAVIGDDEPATAIGTVDLGAGRTATAVTAGWHHTCAILDTQAVKCWGQNNSGQLGTGAAGANVGDDETPANSATVNLGAGATAISAGRFHTCAILTTGAVRCWGVNNSGQLGSGNTENVGDDEPPSSVATVDLGAGRTARAIASGYEHTCAVLDNGSLRCWGRNDVGQLGLGTTANVGDDETPASVAAVGVGAGRTAVSITAGYDNTCATLDDATVRCWGSNHVGQLAQGQPVPLQPAEVLDPQGSGFAYLGDNELPTTMPAIAMGGAVQAVATGTFHSCAVLGTQGVKCWGAGSNGRTGYGDTSRRGDDESPSAYGTLTLGGVVGSPTTTSTTTSSTTTTTAAAPATTTPAPPTTVPAAPPTVPPPPPADTRAPRIVVWRGNPTRVGADGRVCAFVTSDEVAIVGLAIQVPGRGLYRSQAAGAGPTFAAFLCVTLPRNARPTRAVATTFVGAGLDAAGNLSFDVRTITLTR